MTPKQYEKMKNRSQRFQDILISLVKDRNDRIKAGDILAEIIDLEIQLEAECNQ